MAEGKTYVAASDFTHGSARFEKGDPVVGGTLALVLRIKPGLVTESKAATK